MRIIWSPDSASDIERLYNFLRPKNPAAARRAIQTIRAGVKTLLETPWIGRPLPKLGVELRERLISFGASVYVVRYRVNDDRITILAVRHGREVDDLD